MNETLSFDIDKLIDLTEEIKEGCRSNKKITEAELQVVTEIALKALGYRKPEPVLIGFGKDEDGQLKKAQLFCPRCGELVDILDIGEGEEPHIDAKPYCSSWAGSGCGQALRYDHVLRDIREKLQEPVTAGDEEEEGSENDA